jgi:hypothetical protein
MKEVAEIIESGPLDERYRPVEFIKGIERYAAIE